MADVTSARKSGGAIMEMPCRLQWRRRWRAASVIVSRNNHSRATLASTQIVPLTLALTFAHLSEELQDIDLSKPGRYLILKGLIVVDVLCFLLAARQNLAAMLP